jgi:geranylgeranyl diphosphate synthase type II
LSPSAGSRPRARAARRGARDPFAARRTSFERYLARALAVGCGAPGRLGLAIEYAALSPGKRVRPLLALASCEAVGGRWRAALPAAAAVECVHAFSLVHDDLPAMDDDDFRRGLPTTHRKFDEGTAILAGDALLAFAFQELTRLAVTGTPATRVVQAIHRLARAAGGEYLMGGQALDLEAEGRKVGEWDVCNIHRRKTGALFGAAMALGGLAGGGSPARVDALESAGRQLGLAFQIQDDLLDEAPGPARAGAPAGRRQTRSAGADAMKGKATYPRAVGAERSRAMAASHLDLSLFILDEYRLLTPRIERLIAATAARAR